MAEVNWDAITTEELNHSLGARLSQLEEQIYNLKRKELDALIAQRLLAHKLLRKDVGLATDLGRELNVSVGVDKYRRAESR